MGFINQDNKPMIPPPMKNTAKINNENDNAVSGAISKKPKYQTMTASRVPIPEMETGNKVTKLPKVTAKETWKKFNGISNDRANKKHCPKKIK
jgi:hypothetical protein